MFAVQLTIACETVDGMLAAQSAAAGNQQPGQQTAASLRRVELSVPRNAALLFSDMSLLPGSGVLVALLLVGILIVVLLLRRRRQMKKRAIAMVRLKP